MVVAVAALGLLCYVAVLVGLSLARRDATPVGLEVAAVEQDREPLLERFYDTYGERQASRIVVLLPPFAIDYVQQRIDAAGRPEGLSVGRYFARVAVWSTIGVVLAVVLLPTGGPVLAVLVGVLGVLGTDLWLTGVVSRRQGRIDRDMPDFLDILASTVGAGLQFRTALGRVARARPGPLSEEIMLALRQMGLGMSRRDALEHLRARNESEALATFVTALLQAEELGAPLSETLLHLATEMRRDFRHQALRRAAKAVPKLTLVVVFLVLPGTMILMFSAFLLSRDGPLIDLSGIAS